MRYVIVGLLFALTSSLASAQFITGNKLKEWMAANDRIERGSKSSGDFDDASSAISYVTGVAESYSNLNLICLPQGATVGQLVAVVGRFLDENPASWNRQANLLAFAALAKAFPCQKK